MMILSNQLTCLFIMPMKRPSLLGRFIFNKIKMTNDKNNQEVKKPAEFQKYAFANVAAQLAKEKEDPEFQAIPNLS